MPLEPRSSTPADIAKPPPSTTTEIEILTEDRLSAARLAREVLTISVGLVHGSPTITLGVYGHLFTNSDDRAAQIIEAVFAASKTE